ncbi:hypothetical protein MO973_00005, partial [Paenibacillus sp. TRM 82003]|nr:hypothetical protein [Paenibacillus sp. TRM 82003]
WICIFELLTQPTFAFFNPLLSGIAFYSFAFRLSFRHSLRFTFRDGVFSGHWRQGISCDLLWLNAKPLTFQFQG